MRFVSRTYHMQIDEPIPACLYDAYGIALWFLVKFDWIIFVFWYNNEFMRVRPVLCVCVCVCTSAYSRRTPKLIYGISRSDLMIMKLFNLLEVCCIVVCSVDFNLLNYCQKCIILWNRIVVTAIVNIISEFNWISKAR